MGDFIDAQAYISQQRDILIDEDTTFTLFKLALVTFFGEKDSSAKSYAEKLAPDMVDSAGNFREEEIATKVGAMLGILYLKYGNIRQAVAIFLKLSPKAVEGISDIVTADDIAVYITLGALVTFSRAELGYLSKSDAVYLQFAEESQQDLPHLITLLLNSNFCELFERLESYKTDYLLDPNLCDVIGDILYRVRVRCYVQYLTVFSSVTLESMASAFAVDSKVLEGQIKDLIESDTVQILIDQKNQVRSQVISIRVSNF